MYAVVSTSSAVGPPTRIVPSPTRPMRADVADDRARLLALRRGVGDDVREQVVGPPIAIFFAIASSGAATSGGSRAARSRSPPCVMSGSGAIDEALDLHDVRELRHAAREVEQRVDPLRVEHRPRREVGHDEDAVGRLVREVACEAARTRRALRSAPARRARPRRSSAREGTARRAGAAPRASARAPSSGRRITHSAVRCQKPSARAERGGSAARPRESAAPARRAAPGGT